VSVDFSHGAGEVFGLLTFIGLVLMVSGYSNERLRRRTPTRSRQSVSGAVIAAGKAQMILGAVALFVGLPGISILWALT
jgi:hypothetical protein